MHNVKTIRGIVEHNKMGKARFVTWLMMNIAANVDGSQSIAAITKWLESTKVGNETLRDRAIRLFNTQSESFNDETANGVV